MTEPKVRHYRKFLNRETEHFPNIVTPPVLTQPQCANARVRVQVLCYFAEKAGGARRTSRFSAIVRPACA